MTLSVSYYDGVKYHSSDFMNRDKDFFGNGVVQATHFPYTLDATADMNINIGTGVAWVDGYRIYNDSNNITLAVSQADSTNPRIDIVQIGHDDVNSQAVLVIKSGVAAASPVEPSADPNYLKLYAINVPANATSISASNITDRRTLVPLNVTGTQITVAGAAGTGQVNNFTQTQQFTASTSSIEANQIVLGQTNNVSSPTSPITLASANAKGLGMDQYGNLLPINPSAIVSGNSWSVQGKGGTSELQVFVDGSHKVTTENQILDDGSGNSTIAGNATVNGNLTANGSTTTKNLQVNGSLKTAKNTLDDGTSGNATIAGTATVTGNLTVNGTTTTTNSLQANGSLKSAKNTLDDSSGNATISGNATVSGNLTASGTATISGNLTANGTTTTTKNLQVNGSLKTSSATIDDGSGNATLGTLAFNNSSAVHFDKFGNVNAPSTASSGNAWSVLDKNGTNCLQVLTDGSESINMAGKLTANGGYGGLGRVPAYTWSGTINGNTQDVFSHNLGYIPIILCQGTLGNINLTIQCTDNNTVYVHNYGSNNWTGQILMW